MDQVRVLYDADVNALADMGELVQVIRGALAARAQGRLIAPPRTVVNFGPGNLAFTIGGRREGEGEPGLAGFRVYSNFAKERPDWPQIVAVWNTSTATLEGLILGERLGNLRTGAIGGCAAALLARQDARSIGLIGAGRQAETQLLGLCAVRPIDAIRVFSRTPAKREAFCRRMSDRLGIAVTAVDSAEAAVRGSDIVILATTAGEPLIRREWLAPGAHVHTLGHKLNGDHELPIDIAEAAEVIVTDSPEQTRSSGDRHFLAGSSAWGRITDLAEVAAGNAPGRTGDDQITLLLSVGLAGTEVFCGQHLLTKAS